MSENRGKAKAKPTAKSAGKNKAAVMNSRNPKKPMAISGDTMSNYAMYKKGGLVKAQAGIWKKEKSINEDGSSMTRRTSNNPITGNRRVVTKIKSADGDKSRSVKISSRQKGGKVRKYQDGGPAISDPKLQQRSREFIGRPEKLDPRMDPMMKPYKSIQSRPLPPQIKEGITPESSRTSKYTTNDSAAIQYRKQKGGMTTDQKKKAVEQLKKQLLKNSTKTISTSPMKNEKPMKQKGGKTSPPPIGTGSKVDMVKNLYKKYIKK